VGDPLATGALGRFFVRALIQRCQRRTTVHVGRVVAALSASGRCHGVPRNERARSQKALVAGAKPMSSNGEQVANDIVDCEESLGVCH